jgi:hypothetical protein
LSHAPKAFGSAGVYAESNSVPAAANVVVVVATWPTPIGIVAQTWFSSSQTVGSGVVSSSVSVPSMVNVGLAQLWRMAAVVVVGTLAPGIFASWAKPAGQSQCSHAADTLCDRPAETLGS